MLGINLLFDAKTSKRIVNIWKEFKRFGSKLSEETTTPHITLAIYEGISEDIVESRLNRLHKKLKSFKVEIGTLGIFPSTPDVISLIVNPSQELVEVFGKVFDLFRDVRKNPGVKLHKYYYPDKWIPHITICNRIERNVFCETMNMAQKLLKKPINAEVVALSYVNFERGKSEINHVKFPL